MSLTLRQIKDAKQEYCNNCKLNCTGCKIKDFIQYLGLKSQQGFNAKELMKADVPLDIVKSGGVYKQKRCRVFK